MVGTLRFLSKNTIQIILVFLVVLFSLSRPDTFLSGLNITNIARQVSFDSLIVLGEVMVLIGGGIDLSVGSRMTWISSFAAFVGSVECARGRRMEYVECAQMPL